MPPTLQERIGAVIHSTGCANAANAHDGMRLAWCRVVAARIIAEVLNEEQP